MKQNKQANEKNKLLSNYLKSHTFGEYPKHLILLKSVVQN